MRKYKERAVKYFILFMLFMLICTVVSRGIYAYQMPQITTGTIEAHTLTRTIKADGSIITKEEVPVVTGPGFLVEKVCVVAGEKVEPADVLFQIELSDLKKLLDQLDMQIQAEEAKLAELNVSGNSAVNRASQDLNDVSNTTAGEVSHVNEAYQAARIKWDSFPSEEVYRKNAYKQDAEYQKLLKASEKKKATKEDKRAFQEYKKSLDAKLMESYIQEKQALSEEVSEKEQAVNEANANRNDAMKQAQRALEDAKNDGGGTKLEQENQIRQLKENREGVLQLRQSEGKVVCGISGYVSRILVQAGERTGDASIMVLSDGGGEKLFQAILPQEEKNYVTAGDKMSLSFSSGTKNLSGVEIEAVGELEDGSCQVTGKIDDRAVTIGETAGMEINKEIGRYSCTVPLSALHTKNNSDYVMIVEEQETILGTELTARMRKVKVLEKDEEYAALEDGALTDEEKFVLESSKDLKDGARVRLQE